MSHHETLRLHAAVAALFLLPLAGCSGPASPASVPQPESYADLDTGLARAMRTAVRAVEKTPERQAPWKQLCMVYHANEFWNLAADCYRQTVESWPDQAWYRYHLARVLEQQGDIDGAIREMSRAIGTFEFYAPAHTRLGEWRLDRGDLTRAEEHFAQALEITPDEPAARLAMARLHLARSEAEQALQLLQPLVRESRDPTYAYGLLAQAFEQLGRTDESQVAARRGIDGRRVFKHDPWSDEVAEFALVGESGADRAVRLMATGRADEAIPILEEMRAANPEDLGVLIRLAQALLRADRTADALVVLQEADALHPDEFGVQFEMASAFHLSGEADSALARIERAIELAPDAALAYHRKGGILQSLRRFEEAARTFGQAVERQPGDPSFLRAEGDSWAYAGDHGRALESYYRAVNIDSTNPELYVRIGIASAKVGRLDNAEQAFVQAQELGPQDPRVDELLRQVRQARQGGGDAEPADEPGG